MAAADDLITGRTSREIADSIEMGVGSGVLQPLDPLPSVRALAARLNVSPSTVAAAYRDLRIRGVATSEAGRVTRIGARPPVHGEATPVAAVRAAAPAGVHLRELSDGNPDPVLLPDLVPILHGLDLPRYLYGESTVVPELAGVAYDQFADLGAQLGTDVGQVCVVGGALDGVERVLASHARPGDRVIVEDPGHTGVVDLVRAMGLDPVGVEIDDAGPLPDEVERALRTRPVACVVTPRAQNPTGAAIDAQRAAHLREVLTGHPDVVIVENDHASIIAGVPHVTLCAGRRNWAVVRSVSQSLGPDVRVGFLAGDPRTTGRVAGRHLLGAGWVSRVLQHVVARLLGDEAVRTAIQQAAAVYQERREALRAQLDERGIAAHGRSGFNVLVPVPHEVPVIQQMQTRGWALRAGEAHRLRSAPFIRVTTATLTAAESRELADDLATALAPQHTSPLT